MPNPLSAQELNELEAFIPATFEDFETAYWAAIASEDPTPAEQYYQYLANKGFGYGNSALGVVRNDTGKGQIANLYAEKTAAESSIDLSFQSENWLQVQYELMKGDHTFRDTNSGSDLTYDQQLQNHAAAHNVVSAPAETFTSHIPLSQVAEFDPVLAQALWEEIIDDNGIKDGWFEDGLKLGFNANLAAQPFPDLLEDYAAQAAWYGRLALAIRDLGSVELAELYTAYGQDFEDSVEAFIDLVDGLFGQDDPTMQPWLQGLLDVPALRDLPGWIGDALTPFDDAKTTSSPLTVDLDSDGIELTAFNAATTTTFFDLDGDSFAEQTAWVSADDGLLVRDLNANGKIDDVDELFGSATIDGFALLAELDSNGDLRIDASDTNWGSLRVWKDTNGDAVTQSGELLTLASLDIVSIDLAGVTASTSTINGNPISHTSTFKYENGSTAAIVDAWFVHDNVNTFYTGDYTLDPRALFLPTLRGFGKLPDLHVAISSDATLLGLVEDFAVGWGFDSFAAPATLDADIVDILYEWAGVEAVSPTSRGANVDAQHLEFLEEYFGEEFYQWGFNPNPWINAGAKLEESWSALFDRLQAHLILQAGGAALFADPVTYNVMSGDIEGSLGLSQGAIDDLVDYATDTGVDTEGYWLEIARFLEMTKGLANITVTEEGWLDTALGDSGLSDTWDDIVDTYNNLNSNPGDTIEGTSGNDTLTGTSGDDDIIGLGGTDILYGGAGFDHLRSALGADANGDELYGESGDDFLEGSQGDDLLSPGTGGDRAEGGHGDDTYVYTGGDDVYRDEGAGSTDKIVMPTGIELADLSFHRLGNYNLLIEVGSLGSIQIEWQLNVSALWESIETIEFDDQSTLNLLTIDAPATYGTDGDDALNGIQYGAANSNDTFYALGGDDTIHTGNGTNFVDGGAGNDVIYLEGDSDTVLASPGFDRITVSDPKTATLQIPEPYSDDDVSFLRYAADPDALYIYIEGLGQIEADVQFYSSGGEIATITFEDESPSINLLTVQIETRGTNGNDSLDGIGYGGSQNDVLNPLGGNDSASGGQGDDTFLYTGGQDYYFDSTGTDVIDIADTWTLQDLSFRRDLSVHASDLIIYIDANNSIRLDRQLVSANGEWETLRLHDGSGDIDIFNDLVVETHGTATNNTINGITFGASDDDVIYGYAGADSISGGTGDDIAYGGDGNDTLSGNNDNDTLDGGAGDDTLRGNTGNDTYVFGAGLDNIQEQSGTDTLLITGGVTINDISVSDVSTWDTKVTVTASVDEVTINNLRYPDTGYRVETIKFDDGFYADLPSYNSWLKGTSGNDTVAGNTSDNVLIGYAGNDSITGDAGADHAHGGDGADTIDGGAGADLLYGGTGDDTITGGTGADVMNGGDGTDTVDYSGDGAAVTVNLATGAATDGNADSDTLSNFENVTGSAYNDGLTGDSSANTLTGGDGDDTLKGGAGNDTLTGGNGSDTIDYSAAAAGVTVDLGNNSASNDGDGGSDTLSGIENVIGSAFADTITGSSVANVLSGGGGNDAIFGAGANDTLSGGDGDDTIHGNGGTDTIDGGDGTDTVGYGFALFGVTVDLSAGTATGDGPDTLTSVENVNGSIWADTITGSSVANVLSGSGGNDNISGGDGDDTLKGGAGNDTLTGGNGSDTIDYSAAAAGVTVDLANDVTSNDGDGGSDTLSGIENVIGSAFADTITGSSVANVLSGGGGNDAIFGAGANDTLSGGDGDDTIHGNGGTDTINGGDGTDTVGYGFAVVGVTVDLSAGTATGDGPDTLISIENVNGSLWADTITGSSAANVLSGSGGNDTIHGGDGLDTLYGGAGADTFVFENASAFNNVDTINDFSTAANDVLDFTDILSAVYDPLTDAITDFIQITDNGTDSTVAVDANGGADNFVAVASILGVTGLTDEEALETSGHLLAA